MKYIIILLVIVILIVLSYLVLYLYSSNNKIKIAKNEIYEKLAVMIFDSDILLFSNDEKIKIKNEELINLLILSDNYKIKKLINFNIKSSEELNRLQDFIINNSSQKDYFIIFGKNNYFTIFDYLFLTYLGFPNYNITNSNKYLIIHSKNNNFNYQNISKEHVIFPILNNTNYICKDIIPSIKSLKNKLLYNNADYRDNKIKKCMIEAWNLRNKYYGVSNKGCFMIDDLDYQNYLLQNDNKNCLNGVGQENSMAIYKIETDLEKMNKNMKNKKVKLCENNSCYYLEKGKYILEPKNFKRINNIEIYDNSYSSVKIFQDIYFKNLIQEIKPNINNNREKNVKYNVDFPKIIRSVIIS